MMFGERIAEIETVFSFDLDEKPIIERGTSEVHPAEISPAVTISLRDGRSISLVQIHQFASFAGWLEGMPHPYWAFMNALDHAKSCFPSFSSTPAVLPPPRYAGTLLQNGEQNQWVTIPPLCSIALFTSGEPVRDMSSAFSDAVVIWFQDQFGLPTDERTIQQLAAIDWQSVAVDGNY